MTLIDSREESAFLSAPGDWQFAKTFKPPVDLPQAFILCALFAINGNSDRVFEPDTSWRLAIALHRIAGVLSLRRMGALSPFLGLASVDQMQDYEALIERKCQEGLMRDMTDANGLTRDGYVLALQLDKGDVADVKRFNADVQNVFGKKANRQTIQDVFRGVADIECWRLPSTLEDIIR